jgi:hypothetical protein
MKPGGIQAIQPYGTDEERGEPLIPTLPDVNVWKPSEVQPLRGPGA